MYIQRPLCLASAAFVLILYIYVSIFPASISQDVIDMDKTKVRVIGTVEKKEFKGDILKLYLKNVQMSPGVNSREYSDFPYKVVANISDYSSGKNRAVKTGGLAEIAGTFRLYDTNNNEGEYDARTANAIKGYGGYLTGTDMVATGTDYSHIKEYLFCLRLKCCGIFDLYMDEQDSSVMRAIILGDKSELDPEIKDIYTNAGIAHILSLSGLHIAAVGMCILKVLRRLPIPLWMGDITATLLITGYAIMTGMSLSTVRALIMFVICVLAQRIGRTYDLLTAAAISSVIILFTNPYLICDSGFGLSFGAIMGIACVYPLIRRPTGRPAVYDNKPQLISSTIDGIIASVSITLATLPISLSTYYMTNLYSIVMNIFVIPLMSILLLSGFMGLIIGMIPVVIAGKSTELILQTAHYILLLYRKLSLAAVQIPGGITVTGKPQRGACIIYYIILATSLVLINMRIGRYMMAVYIMSAVAVLTAGNINPFEIVNLAVGQGDCAVISGADIPVIMIDGGSSSEKDTGRYTIKPFLLYNGHGTVDFLIISHADTDHVSGILELLEDEGSIITIRNIIISEASLSDTVFSAASEEGDDEYNDNLQRIIVAAGRRNIPVKSIKTGDRLTNSRYELLCMSPGKESSGNVNEDSLVLKLTHYRTGFTALFTGDIGTDTENCLVSVDLDSDYLKVAHHGSKNSSSNDFLDKVTPGISVISVPEKSVYGHPHEEAVERIKACGSRLYQTDVCGQIRVIPGRRGITVEKYLP